MTSANQLNLAKSKVLIKQIIKNGILDFRIVFSHIFNIVKLHSIFEGWNLRKANQCSILTPAIRKSMVKNPQIYESFLLSITEGYILPLSLLDTPFQFSKVQNPRNMIPFLTVLV